MELDKLKRDHAELYVLKDRQIKKYLDELKDKNNRINELILEIQRL